MSITEVTLTAFLTGNRLNSSVKLVNDAFESKAKQHPELASIGLSLNASETGRDIPFGELDLADTVFLMASQAIDVKVNGATTAIRTKFLCLESASVTSIQLANPTSVTVDVTIYLFGA